MGIELAAPARETQSEAALAAIINASFGEAPFIVVPR